MQLIVRLLATLVCTGATIAAIGELEYDDRGGYWEGIRDHPIGSNLNVELLSVVAAHEQLPVRLPKDIRLWFFLSDDGPAYLSVRERNPEHYYLLDRVSPHDSWRAGDWASFAWPTETVLARLDPTLEPGDMAFLVRLGVSTPGTDERVAPVVVAGERNPSDPTGYLFTFESSVDASIEIDIVRLEDGEKLHSESHSRKAGGTPFTIFWRSAGLQEGSYRLVLHGEARRDYSNMHLTIDFEHRLWGGHIP